MSKSGPKILLIEDDEDDYRLIGALLADIDISRYHLEWAPTYEAALQAMERGGHDICLLDFYLGERNGVELMKQAMEKGCNAPIILLTGKGDYDVDLMAMEAGAADYLTKSEITPAVLERTIRYALAHKELEEELRRSVSDLVKAEESLRESERYFRSIIENMNEDIFIVARDETVVDVNKPLMASVELERGEAIGRLFPEIFPNYELNCRLYAPECMLTEVFAKGVPCKVRLEHHHGDWSKWLSIHLSPLRDTQGRILYVICVVRDITHEIDLEALLRRAQKMEAIGMFASGIAHDFNNILNIVLGNTELARLDASEDSRVHNHLQNTLRACEQAKDLVGRILTLGSPGSKERRPVRIGTIVNETLKLLTPTLPPKIELRYTDDQLPCPDLILADVGQVHQLILNLCTNALQAMGSDGGILDVGLCPIVIGGDAAHRCPSLKQGSYVRLVVKDTGKGMSPEVMKRIFEPYFSTKAAGVGTGLGLSVVQSIIEGHGGAIEVRSSEGKGTAFSVYFPRLDTVPMKSSHAVCAPITDS